MTRKSVTRRNGIGLAAVFLFIGIGLWLSTDPAHTASLQNPIPVGSAPSAVAVNSITNKIYVGNRGSHSVNIIDGADNSTVAVQTGDYPNALGVNTVTNKLYVANFDSGSVTVIDGAGNVVKTLTAGLGADCVAVNSVTNKIYVTNLFPATVTVIDGSDDSVVDTLAVGGSPVNVAINSVTNKIYVANTLGLTVIDGSNNSFQSYPAGTGCGDSDNPKCLAVNSATNRIYLPNGNTVSIVNGADNTFVTLPIGEGLHSTAINSATDTIYITNSGSDNVTVINGANNTVAATVPAGLFPLALAVNETTNRIYVANANSDNVTIIKAADNSMATVPVGDSPLALDVNPATNLIYVANFDSNNVTVIPGIPGNDDFANAQVLNSIPGKLESSSVGATTEPGEPNFTGTPIGASVWYQWTAADTRRVTFTTQDSLFDTLLVVYKYTGQSISALTPSDMVVFNNDDAQSNCQGQISRVSFNPEAGATYRIGLYGVSSATGSIVLRWGYSASIAVLGPADASFTLSGDACRSLSAPGTFTDVPTGANYDVQIDPGPDDFGNYSKLSTGCLAESSFFGCATGLLSDVTVSFAHTPNFGIRGNISVAGGDRTGVVITVTASNGYGPYVAGMTPGTSYDPGTGNYSFGTNFPNLWTEFGYTVTATKPGYNFGSPVPVPQDQPSGSYFTANFSGSPAANSIGGRLTYQDSATGARNVTMTLTGNNGFVTRTATTDNNGDYSFTNVPPGNNYTVTPSRTAEAHDAGITAFDASLAAQFAATQISLSPNKRIAGDTSNSGTVTAFDASQIARYQLSIPVAGSIAGGWKFSPASLTFNNLSADQTNQNATAILVGDISGNWTPSGPTTMAPQGLPAIPVALPIKQDPPAGTSTIPIVVGDTTGQGIFAYDFDMFFDPAVLQLQSPAFDVAGTMSAGWSVNTSTTTDINGKVHLILNAFNVSPLTGQGTLIKLKFNVIGGSGSSTPLAWADFNFNEGSPPDTDINGNFTAASPSAAAVRVSGRIVDAEDHPVAGTTVTVSGSTRTVRAITDSNGFYRVEGLEAGGFYTVIPARANFAFAPASRSFSLVADKTDAVFTGTGLTADSNPLESPEFFVRQQYLDFLSREPEQSGLDYWSGQLRACDEDAQCLNERRTSIASEFYITREFQESGLFIHDLYEGALARRPDYAEYVVDRRQVVGGPRLEADKASFAARFVERDGFRQQYPASLSAAEFVDALLQKAQQASGIDLSDERTNLIDLFNAGSGGTESRHTVLRTLVEISRFKQTQYNSAFVLAEYYGYLGRNPEREGYEFWLNVLNSGERNNYGGMVCSFITSAEYQRRFSPVVTRNNAECGQ
jgi:YVTN family beta-propeller protein